MIELLSRPLPWYVAGPLIGLMVPTLLLVGNKLFGISSTFRHACAACIPGRSDFFRYDWRGIGGWNLVFAIGVLIGGVIAGTLLANPDPIGISEATRADLAALGVTEFDGIVPAALFSWEALLSVRGFLMLVVGGFLVGFGAAYAGGCTSGHGVAGLADMQASSLVAVVGFFVGGLLSTYLLLPLLL
jgi:uncharacterized protein